MKDINKIEKELIVKAKEGLKEYQSFSISTLIPKKELIKEEEEFDKGKEKSIKTEINERIVRELTKDKEHLYSPTNYQIRLIFDFVQGELRKKFGSMFIFGRYHKKKPGISQTRWVCKWCGGRGCERCEFKGKRYLSIEEIIGEPAKDIFKSKGYFLHASGREDVDVINTAGRAFVLELRGVKDWKMTRKKLEEIKEILDRDKRVSISDIRIVNQGWVALVSDSHFDKEYEAVVDIPKGIKDKEIEIIKNFKEKIKQYTPQRVEHRRSKKIRERKIFWIKVLEKITNKRIKIRIKAEAGTYIKEFIDGDSGRTNPSISGIIKKEAKCIELKVVRIHDQFFDLCK